MTGPQLETHKDYFAIGQLRHETLMDQYRWFNAGCDARFAGEPISNCPYPSTKETSSAYACWRAGWKDMDEGWGKFNRRHQIRPLVPLHQDAKE
jgi:hypothetical protein